MEDLSSPDLVELPQETIVQEANVNDGENINVSRDDPIVEPSDLWSSVATDGYLTLTTHFVDRD